MVSRSSVRTPGSSSRTQCTPQVAELEGQGFPVHAHLEVVQLRGDGQLEDAAVAARDGPESAPPAVRGTREEARSLYTNPFPHALTSLW